MNIVEFYDEFCKYVKSRYKSKHTQRAYLSDVSDFLDNCNSEKFDCINKYVVLLKKQGVGARSINRKLSSVSAYFNFLKSRNIIDKNPVDFVDKPKMEKKLPVFLDVDEIIGLLNSIENKRDRALLELIYSSSLRASETVLLNIEDVDCNNFRIRVQRKGDKVSYVPVSRRACKFIMKYIKDRKNGALFLNRYGNRLSTRSLQKIVKKYSLNSIFKDISPHTLRHSKATHLLNSGMDIRLLQKFLGHSSIVATQIYTHLNLKELAKTYDKTHPLAKDEEK